jgi:hypothetical protein
MQAIRVSSVMTIMKTARSQDLACREQCACRAGAVAQDKFVLEEGDALRGSVPALVAVTSF